VPCSHLGEIEQLKESLANAGVVVWAIYQVLWFCPSLIRLEFKAQLFIFSILVDFILLYDSQQRRHAKGSGSFEPYTALPSLVTCFHSINPNALLFLHFIWIAGDIRGNAVIYRDKSLLMTQESGRAKKKKRAHSCSVSSVSPRLAKFKTNITVQEALEATDLGVATGLCRARRE
jgi:hypothetical protein